MAQQMTVKALYLTLQDIIKEGYGDRKIVVSDDNEGNGYHGLFYGVSILGKEDTTGVTNAIMDLVYDTDETNPDKLVVLG